MIRKRAQSILEYAGLIAIVVGALIAMQVIIKRGLQGKYRSTADDIGEQYSPRHTTGITTITTISTSTEDTENGETVTTSTTHQEVSKSQHIATMDQEYWGE